MGWLVVIAYILVAVVMLVVISTFALEYLESKIEVQLTRMLELPGVYSIGYKSHQTGIFTMSYVFTYNYLTIKTQRRFAPTAFVLSYLEFKRALIIAQVMDS